MKEQETNCMETAQNPLMRPYESPTVEIIEVACEKGFAISDSANATSKDFYFE